MTQSVILLSLAYGWTPEDVKRMGSRRFRKKSAAPLLLSSDIYGWDGLSSKFGTGTDGTKNFLSAPNCLVVDWIN